MSYPKLSTIHTPIKKFLLILCPLAAMFMLTLPAGAIAAVSKQISMTWACPDTTTIAGFCLYNNGTLVHEVNDPKARQLTTTLLLDEGLQSFTMTAVDTNGNESTHSSTYTLNVTASNSGELIVDNGDVGTSSTGTWKTSGGSNPYGGSSLYSDSAGATYTFKADVTGSAEVALWWTEYSNRSTAVPVEIYDGSTLIDMVYVNQQVNGGKWNALGTYEFASGTASIVILSEGGVTTSADAIQLLKVSPDTSSSNSAAPTVNGQEFILDNGASGTYATGTWKVSGGLNSYGSDSLFSNDVGATYTFEANVTGSTEIALWWTEYSNRSTAVPIAIYDGGTLLQTVYVNQQINGGKWNTLGIYKFTSGIASIVLLSEGGGSVCADAVQFTPITVTDTNTTTSGSSTNTSNDPTSSPPQPMIDNELIIDNGEEGSYAAGTWKVSGGLNPYGGDSLFSNDTNATYTFEAATTGSIEIALWWTEYDNRGPAVPVEIYDGTTLIDTVYVNQQMNGGQWNILGSYEFTSNAISVVIVSEGGGTACADAVRFIRTAETASTHQEVIVDNADPEAVAAGSWKISGGLSPYNGSSVFSNTGGDSFTFSADITGTTEVALWWTEYSNRGTTIPVEIYDGAALIDTVYVNQQIDGGKWNTLGTYEFTAGTIKVVILSEGGATACADAVRFNTIIEAVVSPSQETIVDNNEAATTAVGAWKISGGLNPYNGSSVFSNTGGDSFTFTADITGTTEIALWWTEYSNRGTTIPVEIYDGAALIDTVYVNQQIDGGKWNTLGTYDFTTGTIKVVILSEGGATACADAARFTKN